jgi:hypothetical protein
MSADRSFNTWLMFLWSAIELLFKNMVAQLEMSWLSWGCGGSRGDGSCWECGGFVKDAPAQLEVRGWLSWGCGSDSVGDVAAQLEMGWLSWGYGAWLRWSWLSWGCGGFEAGLTQLGMWWLSWECGGSAKNVVAQLGMWWLISGCGGSISSNQPHCQAMQRVWHLCTMLVKKCQITIKLLIHKIGDATLHDSGSPIHCKLLHSVYGCLLPTSDYKTWGSGLHHQMEMTSPS